MVAGGDFSGLMSSTWAFAKAEASAATDSLDRGMGGLPLQHIKAHRPRARALGPHPMADRLLGVVRHQGFELALRALVVEKGFPRVAEELGPPLRQDVQLRSNFDVRRLVWPSPLELPICSDVAGALPSGILGSRVCRNELRRSPRRCRRAERQHQGGGAAGLEDWTPPQVMDKGVGSTS